MSLILTPFSMLLSLLIGVFNSYGIAIMVFAVFVKILLFPFSLKGKKGMIQMSMLQGPLNQLKVKYGKDPERYNQEVQALYMREKVNPLSGCLWSLLPLFVLLPLYAIIRQPLQYIMGLTDDQILLLANQLNWDQVAVELSYVTQQNLDRILEKSVEAGGIISGFSNDAYNQLYLAAMIPETGLTLTDGTLVGYMNFDFFGVNLTHIPNWKLWQDFSLTNIATLIFVAISAVSGFFLSKISQQTNKLNQNQERNEQMEQTNRMMMTIMPITSIWIGLIMPSIMVVYWITNNLLAMIQEIVAGKILKKDYEEAARISKIREEEQKQAEKAEKAAKVKEIERKRQEQKSGGKSKKKKKGNNPEEQQAQLDAQQAKEASRVGLRTYARGRAYDPDRYPNPYGEEEQLASEPEEVAEKVVPQVDENPVDMTEQTIVQEVQDEEVDTETSSDDS